MKERGHAAVEFALASALLLLPVIIVVMAFGPWSEERVLVEAVAAEASRSAVIARDVQVGTRVIETALRERGIPEANIKVGWCGARPSRPAADGGCSMERGSHVEVVVSVWTAVITTPWRDVGGIWITGSHSEPVDVYRSLGDG